MLGIFHFSWRYSSDETKVSYFNWGPSQPVSKETWGCVVIQNDQWYNENCIYPEAFVCETQAERGMLSSVTLSKYTLNIVHSVLELHFYFWRVNGS